LQGFDDQLTGEIKRFVDALGVAVVKNAFSEKWKKIQFFDIRLGASGVNIPRSIGI